MVPKYRSDWILLKKWIRKFTPTITKTLISIIKDGYGWIFLFFVYIRDILAFKIIWIFLQ